MRKLFKLPNVNSMKGAGMAEKKKDDGDLSLERRSGSERRTGKLDEKYKYSVQAGFFLDLRKGERRKKIAEENVISLN